MTKKSELAENGEITYKLRYPIDFGSERITQIKLKRPKGKHVKQLGKDLDLGKLIQVAQKVADVSPPVFDELDIYDYMQLSEVVGDFLDIGQEGGKRS